MRILPIILALAASAAAQNPAARTAAQKIDKPRFTQEQVVPFRAPGPRLLTRGQFVSIYGWNLVPKQWCDELHDQRAPYPQELCGVRVLIGDRPAGLMYAGPGGNPYIHADQINFQVPGNAPDSGTVPIRVCVETTCSDPVPVEFTAKDIIVRTKEAAMVHMPVWIDVEIPMNPSFAYPFGVCPWDFGRYEFEIRQNGSVLPPASKRQCPPNRREPSSSRSSKLPVHLAYQFDVPGTYDVRLSGPILTPDQTAVARMGTSDWIQIEVQPYSEEKRAAWLDSIREKAAKPSGWQQDGELIPSLLAWPNEDALVALVRFLPPPVPRNGPRSFSYSGPPMEVMYCIAPAALTAFPNALLVKYISPERLQQLRSQANLCR